MNKLAKLNKAFAELEEPKSVVYWFHRLMCLHDVGSIELDVLYAMAQTQRDDAFKAYEKAHAALLVAIKYYREQAQIEFALTLIEELEK